MITENLSTLKINKLTKAQYIREKKANNLNENEFYLTPDEPSEVIYYESLYQAIVDINNDIRNNATEDSGLAKVKVFTADNGVLTVMLLDDVSENTQIDINKDINLVLNGKTLNLTDDAVYLNFGDGTSCTIDGTVTGSTISKIISSGIQGTSYYTIFTSGKNLAVNGGSYNVNGSSRLGGISVIRTGTEETNILVENCSISVVNTNTETASSVQAIRTEGVTKKAIVKNSTINLDIAHGNVFGILTTVDIDVYNSSISVITKSNPEAKSRAYGIYSVGVNGVARIKDSIIHADASGCHVSETYSIGIINNGCVFLENVEVFGTHSGIDNGVGGKLYANGGTYVGYCHGGFYFAQGIDGEAYINDATIKCGNYTGVHDYSGKTDEIYGCFYVGGGTEENHSNNTVYLDNCTIGEGFVLRGASNEQNNTVNISNSTILNDERYRLIRIDNETHKVNIGVGTNIATSMIDNPQWAEFTSQLYRKLHKDKVCNGADYNAYITFLNYKKENTNSYILTSSTEGSTKKFKITIDDDGVLTATEIIESGV
jgi:hypothetical protein